MTNTIASTWDVRNSTQENLVAFADIMADAIRSKMVPVADALVPLHHAAIELNRRHSHASLQIDLFGAAATLADFDQYCHESCHISTQATLCAIRAAGCVLDLATDEEWEALEWAGYTRETLTTYLVADAVAEGRGRGFDHRPRVAVLVPADAGEMVAPF